MNQPPGIPDEDDLPRVIDKISLVDHAALRRFIIKLRQPIEGPECIVEEFRRRGRRLDPEGFASGKGPPFAQYAEGIGYPFTWGHILERHFEYLVIWDFCFDQLLKRYHNAGLGLANLQTAMFESLDRLGTLPTERDVFHTLTLTRYQILPGTVVSAFTIVAHFTAEADARAWVGESFIPEQVVELIADAVAHVAAHEARLAGHDDA